MAREAPVDPSSLDPECVAVHQILALSPAPAELSEVLGRCAGYRVRAKGAGTVADWVQYSPESDVSPFPLGRVSLWDGGVLLEAFSERRVDVMRSRLRDLGAGRIPADQMRVFRVPDALARPEGLLQPLHDLTGEPLTAREVALSYLRMAWAFFPNVRLEGRTPAAALRTGRGRKAVEDLLEELGSELRAEIPGFPPLSLDEMHDALLPPETTPGDATRRETPSAWHLRKD